MSASRHPDDETVGRFVLGRLDRRMMAQIESHLCLLLPMRSDRDAGTRRPARDSVAEFGRPLRERVDSRQYDQFGHRYLRSQERIRMSSPKRSQRNLRMLVALTCLAGALGFSFAGCSGRTEPFTVSPEAKAKAQEVWKRKSQDFGEKTKKWAVR